MILLWRTQCSRVDTHCNVMRLQFYYVQNSKVIYLAALISFPLFRYSLVSPPPLPSPPSPPTPSPLLQKSDLKTRLHNVIWLHTRTYTHTHTHTHYQYHRYNSNLSQCPISTNCSCYRNIFHYIILFRDRYDILSYQRIRPSLDSAGRVLIRT